MHCEVLELDPPKRMVLPWAGGNIDTTVTFTLETTGAGNAQTRLRMRHLGFDGLGAQLARRILAGGYPRILRERLPACLDRVAVVHNPLHEAPGRPGLSVGLP